MSPDVELLAPAGEAESLRAAIANGADAIYLGVGPFNARQRAKNFTLDELAEARELTLGCNVRLYVAMNTLLLPSELDPACELLKHLAECGIDGLIVQDVGLSELATRFVPDLPLHASTQMTLTEPAAIAAAKDRWNLRRVILPRETSLAELRVIAEQTDVELELFVHGAICISYSGQCQASRVLGGRSGNRGQCAQPCRMAWDLARHGSDVEAAGPHVFSPRDLSLADRVGDLVRAGAKSLKIEGRLKDALYVAAVVGVYRKALDAALAGRRDSQLTNEDRRVLAMSFSRGFTEGYLDDPAGAADLVDPTAPGNLGAEIGSVESVRGGKITIRLDPGAPRLSPGDGVAFGQCDPDGRRVGGSIRDVRPLGRGRVSIALFAQEGQARQVPEPGQVVWLTADPKLQRELRKTFSRVEPRRRRRIDVRVTAGPGKPMRMRCGDLEVIGEVALETAQRRPLTRNDLIEQLSRLGNTPFELGEVELVGPDGPGEQVNVMAPRSELNALRRRLIDRLALRAQPQWAMPEPHALSTLRSLASGREGFRGAGVDRVGPGVSILVREMWQVEPAAKLLVSTAEDSPALPRRVYLELALEELPSAVAALRAAGVQPATVTPRVISPSQRSIVEALLDLDVDAMLVRNLGSLVMLRQRRPDLTAVGDWSLNTTNELSALALRRTGFDVLTPGAEAGGEALATLIRRTAPGTLELPIRLHPCLFHTQYDPAARSADAGPLTLTDARGRKYALRRDPAGRTDVFAAEAVELRTMPPDVRGRLASVRIELLDEAPEPIAAMTTGLARMLQDR